MSGAVVIAAGGTGGHLFPAIAVARELVGRGRTVTILTDHRGDRITGSVENVQTYRLNVTGLRGRGLSGLVVGMMRLVVAFFRARRLLLQLKPVVIAGFGGYPSVAPICAARSLRLPVVIHEQNAVPGRANRFLASRADLVATSFDDTSGFSDTPVVVCGNPVRESIVPLHDVAYAPPRAGEPFRLLVTGGSQGTHMFSKIVPAAVASLDPGTRSRLRIVQQTRNEDLADVRDAYAEIDADAEIAPFFDDMAERLSAAHLVICRAGASTVAELSAAGRPAILIPYPHAADDHQAANAQRIVDIGGGWMFRESALDPSTLATWLAHLLDEPDLLEQTARAVRDCARCDAASSLADAIVELAGREPCRWQEAT